MKNSFFLTIPPQRKSSDELATYETVALKRWVEEIPTANYGLTTRLLHERIRQLNELEAAAAFRLEALEILRPAFLMIEEYLRSRISATGFPLDENQRKIGDLLVSIGKDFTTAYWMAAREFSGGESGWFQTKSLALAIQRVVRGLGGILIGHYLMATPVPDWLWLDLHSLYRLALAKKREGTKVKDDAGVHVKNCSIEDVYKQILLLSLADPNGLMQREVLELYAFCEKLTGHLAIERKPVQKAGLHCLLLMEEDRPPVWSVYPDDAETDSIVHLLEMEKLAKYFKKHRKRFVNPEVVRFGAIAVSNEAKALIAPELADYLERRWSGVSLGGDAYFYDRLDRMFSIGLKATHHHLNSAALPESGIATEWLVESSSDKSLSCRFDQPGQIFVGSLVSFRRADAEHDQRALGTVCRITMERPDGLVHFQVHLLTPKVYAVGAQPVNAKDAKVYQRTLLHVEKGEAGNKTYVILESQKIKEGDTIRLLMQNDSFPIVLQNRKNIGLGYWQFECFRIAEQQTAEKIPKKGYDFF